MIYENKDSGQVITKLEEYSVTGTMCSLCVQCIKGNSLAVTSKRHDVWLPHHLLQLGLFTHPVFCDHWTRYR